MTAILVGSFSLGDAIPGLSDSLDTVGVGLQALKDSVDSVTGELGALESAINGLATAVDNAKNEIIAGPFEAASGQLTSIQGALSDLQAITDPGAYLDCIKASLTSALDLLDGLNPGDYLSDQIAAVQGAVASTQSALDDFESSFTDLTNIAEDIRAQTALLGDVEDALNAASAAAVDPLVAFTEQVSQLLNTGVAVVHYTGDLGSLGSQVDAVLPGSGIGTLEQVTSPLLVVRTANTATTAALKAAFGIS